jgi:uracil-DNA glycosylase
MFSTFLLTRLFHTWSEGFSLTFIVVIIRQLIWRVCITIFTAQLTSTTLNYTADLNLRINPNKSRICRACGLYLNQLPVIDNQRHANVFWVGLSAVAFNDDDEKLPLSPFTRSGALVAEIEKPFAEKVVFYKTNLVKCLPLKQNKIRYPLQHEMEKCYPNLQAEIAELKPSIVFLLGKQVASFVFDKLGERDVALSETFKYKGLTIGGITYVPLHHPSFILVYKRKLLSKYIKNIQSFFSTSTKQKSKLAKED